MINNHWTYSAVLIAIASAVLGIMVGALVSYRLYRGQRRRQAVYLLLISLLGLSASQFIEQTRVLLFRLSFDGYMSPGLFNEVYNSAMNVSLTKVALSLSLTLSAAVNLGLYCNRSDDVIIKWAFWTVAGTGLSWIGLAYILDPWF